MGIDIKTEIKAKQNKTRNRNEKGDQGREYIERGMGIQLPRDIAIIARGAAPLTG
jgi:hypothetical protein